MKKIVALTLALLMLIGTFAGCSEPPAAPSVGSPALSQASSALEESSSSPESGVPAKNTGYQTEPVTLTAFKNGVAMPPDWEWGDDPTSKRITELTGVTVEVQYAATTDNTEINTMLASGEKLPDFVITDAHGPVRNMMVDQGFACLLYTSVLSRPQLQAENTMSLPVALRAMLIRLYSMGPSANVGRKQ